MFVTLNSANKANVPVARRSAPQRKSQNGSPTDSYTPSYPQSENPTYKPSWAAARTDETRAKMSGFQVAALGLGCLSALGGLVGVAVSSGPSAPAPSPQAEVVTETQSSQPEVELAKTESAPVEEVKKKEFSDGRTLLVDRSERVSAGNFDPDPSQAVGERGGRLIFEEAYISSLMERDLTSVPEGSPRFTALDVDSNQSSKIYFDSNMQEVGFGYGTQKSGDFFTRPTRMNGRGAGIRDEVSQYHLSCVYRLENEATIDGVKLEPGVYRLISMEPASRVATQSMQRGVCPGHRLKPSGSGISGDYVPTQQSKDGEALHVNPDDILQIWSLNAEEAARYE